MAKGFKSGGRAAGTLNKSTLEVKSLAQLHGEDAINTLAKLMKSALSEQARISAARELLDRAYGKPTIKDDEDLDKDKFSDNRVFTVVRLVGKTTLA